MRLQQLPPALRPRRLRQRLRSSVPRRLSRRISRPLSDYAASFISGIFSSFGLSLPYSTDVPSISKPRPRNERIRYPVETCPRSTVTTFNNRSEEHTSELQSQSNL